MGSTAAVAWRDVVDRAARSCGTPCYVTRWEPVQEAVDRLESLSNAAPVRNWLSFKTHPAPPLARRWLRSGRGIEVVSESELVTCIELGCSADTLLVNGVAKHAWLCRHRMRKLRVHFDSILELESLLPLALEQEWRVGVRCHVPDERDARQPDFPGQFGMTGEEAVAAIRRLASAGADLQSIHFHLGQRAHTPGAYVRAVAHIERLCAEARFTPRFLDCGGGLPPPDSAGGALRDLGHAIDEARAMFPALQEIWLENGRFVTGASTALAVRVLDVKERPECRYVICDGGRTNQALAADNGLHAIVTIPERSGPRRETTICGPTCMTDDTLGRLSMPADLQPGDTIVWLDAGAYHLPWETRFSHGLCAVAWWSGEPNADVVQARRAERPGAWARGWSSEPA